jgi:TolB protein
MRRGRPRYPDLLTPREQEVLQLLRDGLTNQQIADRLGISLYGARYHVSEILSKLDVSSREEAAAWQPESAPTRRGLIGGVDPVSWLKGHSAWRVVGGAAIGAAGVALVLLALGVLFTSMQEEPSSELGKLVYVEGGDVWTLVLPDGEPQRLTTDGRNHAPHWSPSGEWVLFEKPVERGAAELWVMRADGSDARRIDGVAYQQMSYGWAPGEDRLAYLSGENETLVVENADGSGRLSLVSSQDKGWDSIGGFIQWSPDGQWLAIAVATRGDVSGNGPFRADYVGLWAVRADGSEARELVAEREVGYGLLVAGWTPDSRQVIYSPDPSFSASYISDGLQWFSVAIDQIGGPVLSGITADTGIDNARRVLRYADYTDASAGGNLLAVRGGGRETYLNKSIAIVEMDGGVHFSDLTNPDEVAATSPAWSPDGSTIAYVAQPLGQGIEPQGVIERRIWLMTPDGANRRRLTSSDTWEERPQWSRDGRHVLYVRPETGAAFGGWEQPGSVEIVLRRLADGNDEPVTVLRYEVNNIETGIWYYGHFDWDQLFDWWQP